jgi:hypothetical protein
VAILTVARGLDVDDVDALVVGIHPLEVVFDPQVTEKGLLGPALNGYEIASQFPVAVPGVVNWRTPRSLPHRVNREVPATA